jgi:hypothetical protein
VPAAGDRILGARGEGEHGVAHHVDRRHLARPLGHEGAGAVVEEGDVGGAGQSADDRVALVTRAPDRVETVTPRPHLARFDILMASDDLGLEQLPRVPDRDQLARADRLLRTPPMNPVPRRPPLHEAHEILVHDVGPVEPVRAAGHRIHHASSPPG